MTQWVTGLQLKREKSLKFGLTMGRCLTKSQIFIGTRPWPALGRQGLVGSLFEYSYTCLASRLRRLARSEIMTSGKDKTPSLLEPSNIPIFQPFPKVSRNRRNNKISWKVIIWRDFVVSLFQDTFEYRKCLKTGELTKFFEYFKGCCCFTVSRRFWKRKLSGNRRNDQITWIQNASRNRRNG